MYTLVTSPSEQTRLSFEDILAGHPYTLLYFYPKDNTPGCTTEALDFSRLYEQFAKKQVAIIGVSKDSVESHCSFQKKHGLSIPLISDPDRVLHEQFGARGEKKMYGKISQGVIRSTFLLESTGNILQEWRNVKATGHAERVLAWVQGHL